MRKRREGRRKKSLEDPTNLSKIPRNHKRRIKTYFRARLIPRKEILSRDKYRRDSSKSTSRQVALGLSLNQFSFFFFFPSFFVAPQLRGGSSTRWPRLIPSIQGAAEGKCLERRAFNRRNFTNGVGFRWLTTWLGLDAPCPLDKREIEFSSNGIPREIILFEHLRVRLRYRVSLIRIRFFFFFFF